MTVLRAPWPTAAELVADAPADAGVLDVAIAAMLAINRGKSEREASVGRVVEDLTLRAAPPSIARLQPVLSDVLAAARVQAYQLVEGTLDGFEVADMRVAPKIVP